jgi:phosphoglycolate phosphatase-like HAD superfamily hydrolase
MGMIIDLIVFDFDGTLFDTSEDITRAMNKSLEFHWRWDISACRANSGQK